MKRPRPYHETILDVPLDFIVWLTPGQFDEFNFEHNDGFKRESTEWISPGMTYVGRKLECRLTLPSTPEEIDAAVGVLT